MDSFTKLIDIVDNLKKTCPSLTDQMYQGLKHCIKEIHYYFKSYFKYEISMDNDCKHHCLKYGLSDPNDVDYAEICTKKHTIECFHCNQLRRLIGTIAWLIDSNHEALGNLNVEAENYDLNKCYQRILAFKAHCLKAICQSTNWENMMDRYDKNTVYVVMDWGSSDRPNKDFFSSAEPNQTKTEPNLVVIKRELILMTITSLTQNKHTRRNSSKMEGMAK